MMEWLRKWMIGTAVKPDAAGNDRRNITWNMIGSLIYAGSSMILTAVVNHLIGPEQGGIFGFAFSTFGQQMFLVAYFGMRPFQSTDVRGSYSFGEYRRVRMFTCLSAVAFGMIYVAVSFFKADGYTAQKAVVVLLMVLYKVIDGFADVYESEFQRSGSLYLTGKAMAFRTIVSVVCFLGALTVTKNLVVSCMVAVAAQAGSVLLFDVNTLKSVHDVSFAATGRHCVILVRECFLLFFSVFLDGFIFAMAKYAIDLQMTSTDTAVFNAIFLPTSVINLAANFVIRPFLTSLSYQWEERRFGEFRASIVKLVCIIAGLTVVAVAGASVLGVPVLSAISNVDLRPYQSGLLLIILGGGFFAVMNLFYYCLVIMKCQRGIFFGYVPVFLAAAVLSWTFVKRDGINGGAISYMMEMLLLMMVFIGEAVWCYKKEKRLSGGLEV